MPNLPDSRRNSICSARVLPATTAVVLVFIALIGLCGGSEADEMIEVALANQTIEGVPIAWDAQTVRMLGRDGRLWELAPAEVVGFKKTASRFHAYSFSEFRASLLRELGADYEVSGAGRYLVAHPRGQRDRWAGRFEQLYRSFVQFFSVRGFAVRQPQFPLVGIVCKDRIDFQALHGGAEAENNHSDGIEGFYNLASNRIAIYDIGGAENSPGRQRNAAVLIHEATHQIAFNTGVHNRYSPPPTWAVEGLALLFEAPGIHDTRTYPNKADRINRDRLQIFRDSAAPRHRPELIRQMVGSDELFRTDPPRAYAAAWAFTFFLSETEPGKYARYLKLTAARPPFQDYTPAERAADFTSVFGDDWRMLEARFLRFISGIER